MSTLQRIRSIMYPFWDIHLNEHNDVLVVVFKVPGEKPLVIRAHLFDFLHTDSLMVGASQSFYEDGGDTSEGMVVWWTLRGFLRYLGGGKFKVHLDIELRSDDSENHSSRLSYSYDQERVFSGAVERGQIEGEEVEVLRDLLDRLGSRTTTVSLSADEVVKITLSVPGVGTSTVSISLDKVKTQMGVLTPQELRAWVLYKAGEQKGGSDANF